MGVPRKADISVDEVNSIAAKFWLSSDGAGDEGQNAGSKFSLDVVCEMYNTLKSNDFNLKLLTALELSQYLERYLWPNWDPSSQSREHLLSIIIMVNEKFRQRVAAWETFISNPNFFSCLFNRITRLAVSNAPGFSMKEKEETLVFLIQSFNSVEVDLIREQIQKYISLPIWVNLSPSRLEEEFKKAPKLKKIWSALEKKDAKMTPDDLSKVMFERKFLVSLIQEQFFPILSSIPSTSDMPKLDKKYRVVLNYCERFLEFLVDIEALLPTRRFFNAVLDDLQFIIRCKNSKLVKERGFKSQYIEARLFCQLLEKLRFYATFEMDDLTGEALSEKDLVQIHYDQLMSLQKIVYKSFPDLKEIYLSNISTIDNRDELVKHFSKLNEEQMINLAKVLKLVDDSRLEILKKTGEDLKLLLTELFVYRYEKRPSQLERLNEMALYPTEAIIWDENLVPSEFFSGSSVLALPKLNIQFLTLHDYLMRNFHLFRLESTYQIRQDIEDAVYRMKPWRAEDGRCIFGGWARMALSIDRFIITEVAKPKLGEKQPSRVRAEISVNLNVKRDVRSEWEQLRKHDVCFLVTIRPSVPPGTRCNIRDPFCPQVGLTYVRGCEIEGMLDQYGKLIDESSNEKPHFDSDYRTYRVWLDCNQYRIDMDAATKGAEDVYDTFNIIIRRKPKENNFKAVLESIRDIINDELVVPEWLHDVLLGYGDPASAHYSNMKKKLTTLDFRDTFLDFQHLKESFPEDQIAYTAPQDQLKPPFKITFLQDKLEVTPYRIPSRGPYPSEAPRMNHVRFTPTQVEAIKSGMQPGLTLIVGPPGTGKTDVAVQIINNIYHSFPNQRTLIVTHSNQALNQLFEKIMALDIDERHMLRLGHGEEELETEKDFTRMGRVNYVLAKRLFLLEEVKKLAESLQITGDVAYTCETAAYFYLYHIISRWEEFTSKLDSNAKTPDSITRFFPFHNFFSDAPQPLFPGSSFEEDFEIARGCFRYIKKIFTQLDEFKAFELLRTGLDRSQYLLIREAKIIAMTCTHAAMRRRDLIEMGFEFDNIVMEEAAQILEIETFIPLLLQSASSGKNRLKRWIQIGDHHQLPPVIKNMAFQKYSNMEQSLFTRLVRLGVPTVDLDAQGRSRASICNLFKWRYKNLGDLPHVLDMKEYKLANPGLAYDYQLINVEDYNGVGESEPIPFYFQNLAEAEYAVGLYMYMRLLGYPAEKITILSTYNGQKHLLRDVIEQRCASNPFIGRPHKVTTVDKYQGQQNDYIILSLVRTKTIGHIRDIRRLVVAVSRARLGLYIFGRVNLFRRCIELAPVFDLLTKRPQELLLVMNEEYGPGFSRSIEAQFETPPTVIREMPEMVEFVYSLYDQKVDEWREKKPEYVESVLNSIGGQNQMEAQEEPIYAETEEQKDENEAEPGEDVMFEPITEEDRGMEDPEIPEFDEEELMAS